jgi:hypothetical protein
MTPAELRTIGESLYGPRWQTKLARALPVNPRTVRRWLAGKTKIRQLVAERIKSLTQKTQSE